MTTRLLIKLLLTLSGALVGQVYGEDPSITSSASASPSSSYYDKGKLASFKERLAAAESVKVQTDLLGLKIGMPIEAAHQKLDPLTDPAKPFVEEGGDDEGGEKKQGEEEHRVVWQLTKSDYSSIYIKADKKDRITYISGILRPGKEIAFAKLGEVEKAPIATETNVAWDVVRPNKPFIRLVARGAARTANSVTIFVVQRP